MPVRGLNSGFFDQADQQVSHHRQQLLFRLVVQQSPLQAVQRRKTLHVEAQRLAERLQELVHLVHQDVRKGL